MTAGAPGQIASRRIFTGKIVNLDVDTVRFPDGSTADLEMIRHPGSAAVVPVLSDEAASDPQILMLRQYRYAAGGPIWEVPAGRVDPGEDPEACARRELLEEAGATARRLERLTTIYTTPGFTDERIHLFAAWGLSVDQHRREPDEFMELAALPISRVLAMMRSGEMADAKSMVAVLFFAALRPGL